MQNSNLNNGFKINSSDGNKTFSRRAFISGFTLLPVSLYLNSCKTQLEDDIEFHCSENQLKINSNLCNQLVTRQKFQTELSLAVLLGASIGSVVGALAVKNPALGALIGGATAGTLAITKNYFDKKIEASNGDLKLALNLTKNDLEHDINLLHATIKDIQFGQTQMQNAITQINEKLSERYINFENAKLIMQNADNNLKSFTEAGIGYREIYSTPILVDNHYESLTKNLDGLTREATGAFFILKRKYEDTY